VHDLVILLKRSDDLCYFKAFVHWLLSCVYHVTLIATIEHRIEKDDHLELMSDQIRRLEKNAAETRVSMVNIQSKIIEVEKKITKNMSKWTLRMLFIQVEFMLCNTIDKLPSTRISP